MSSERWRQIEELYHLACERGVGVLDSVDPEIRGEVEKLLSHNRAGGGNLLDLRAVDLFSELSETPIAPGVQLGPYKIEATLGQGGMGRVYRAKDTRLSRSVAIKICNEEFIDRFEQEARSIAVISHPNVCTLYDVGPNYLVMELVEGETLAARLKRGKLSTRETVRFGAQIAEALSVAHSQGIVHRDLKPGNIMLAKSAVKVLDFGLARSAADPSVTAAGAVMGTPAYLAPELLEGKEADVRSDIYALGLILAEMLTGKRSANLESLPPPFDRVVKRCLDPDPEERWQSARDLKWEIESIELTPAPPHSRRVTLMLAAGLSVSALVIATLGILYFRSRPAAQPLTRVNILVPDNSLVRSLAVSPDGRFISVVLVKDGKQQIWVRAFDSSEITPLSGTDNASDTFWSPDSRFIGFFADAKLKKIERSGGPAQTLCDAVGAIGGTWNRAGDIVIGGLSRVQRVSDAGGAVSNLPGAGTQTYPFFLPDGRHYLGTQGPLGSPAGAGIWLNSMDSPEKRRILPDVSSAQIVAPGNGSQTGAILFARNGNLMALPFDMTRLEAVGDPFPVAQGVADGINSHPMAAANAGVLAYLSGQGSHWQYVWRDRTGKKLGAMEDAGAVVMISPDGKRFVGDHDEGLSIVDIATGSSRLLTFNGDGGQDPAWSPDGRYVAYWKWPGIYRKPANGAGAAEMLIKMNTLSVPKSFSPDGRYLLYAQVNPVTGADLLALPLDKRDPLPLILAQTTANEDQGQFSPDGHWVAYTSNESGQSEIYVIPFPPNPNGGRWLVSRGGGVMPRWRRDGKELFYISPDWKMMAVDVSTKPSFQSGTPHALFETEMVDTGIRTGPMSWDIAADGKRFLIVSENSDGASSLNVVLNWRPDQGK